MTAPATVENWRLRAACRETDARIFFPGVGESLRPAKAVCRRCPVRRDCLAWAMEVESRIPPSHGRHGVFGGVGGKGREKLAARGWPR